VSACDSHTPAEVVNAGHDMCDLARKSILPFFRSRMAVVDKSKATPSAVGLQTNAAPHSADFDPVTEADRHCEIALRALIAERFPADGFIGEEFGITNSGAERSWIVDPIDGTRAFIMGSPLWGCLIGCQSGGRVIFGVMDQPYTQERIWSDGPATFFARGEGETAREGQRLHVQGAATLDEATLTTTHPDLFHPGEELPLFLRLASRARLVRYGGDCYGYALLALGGVDLVVEAGLQAYDLAALIPILEGAGAVITTWDGRPASEGGRILAAANEGLHQQAMALLNG